MKEDFRSFEDVWRIQRRVNSHTVQRAKIRSHGGREEKKKNNRSSTNSCTHTQTRTCFHHTRSSAQRASFFF